MNNKPIYTIIAGVNGTGKSSLCGVLLSSLSDLGFVIDVDRIAKEECISNISAGRKALRYMALFSKDCVSFTQETTLSGKRTLTFARELKEKGFYVRLYYVGLDTMDESIRRIKNRAEKGGHDIPENDVRFRFAHRFETLIPLLSLCDEVSLFDNNNGFVNIADYRNGRFVYKLQDGEEYPKWFFLLKQEIQNAYDSIETVTAIDYDNEI